MFITSLSGYFSTLPHSVPSKQLPLKLRQHPNFYQNIYELDPADPAPAHHTYLAFFCREDGFMRLLPTGLWEGRSLKRFKLVRGNCMVDPFLLTNTSSPPPISTMLKESRNYNPPQSYIQSCWWDTMWVRCKSVHCSGFSVSLCADRKCCCKDITEWLCGVELECRTEWRHTSTHYSHLFAPKPPWGDTPCMHAWWPSKLV